MLDQNIIKMPRRFDYSSSGEFNGLFMTAVNANNANRKIVLDFMQTEYIDSAGIGLLVMTHKKALAHQASLSVMHCKQSVKDILMLANLQKLMEIN